MRAAYALTPHCPKCFQALPVPEWWTAVKDKEDEWCRTTRVLCATCKVTVDARFYDSRGDC
jgi:hypothetical protein